MEGTGPYNPRTVEDVFSDFKGRRAGMIKALTEDVEEFTKQCDPAKENLCLYGFPTESWEVNLPAEEVPPELPEPALGINFARDGMQEKDWLSLVAVHSDAWLLAVAFYFGARFGFDKNQRRSLFNMINEVPTIFEVVNKKKPGKEKSSISNQSSTKSKLISKGVKTLSTYSYVYSTFPDFFISMSVGTRAILLGRLKAGKFALVGLGEKELGQKGYSAVEPTSSELLARSCSALFDQM
ncbi:hypothetical protein GIB67_006006 [Kingdonia uniflora]|uniref:PHD finger protein ALFIN-LIKE n=1 Tax=Kingdonia uniflora TaxID=39325 RepID=A0A7J7MBZ8_9MAGN|nr:hypothetical protein GIB67_006006 [Kingdonia uniflora]